VGIDSASRYRSAIARIEPGEVLFGFTDGVTEVMYTRERFFALLEKPASSAPELIERVKADLFNHIRRAPQSDDITMIAVHRKA
jgi:sigma-B regulation protein RsbU (phosphoserine phosphatase)